MDVEDPLPDHVLGFIVHGHHMDPNHNEEKAREKIGSRRTASVDHSVQERHSRMEHSVPGCHSGHGALNGIDDNLAKILVRRSHGVAISDHDFFRPDQLEEDQAAVPSEPERDDRLPGAYSGAPGIDYGRIQKPPLPQNLRGSATQRQDAYAHHNHDLSAMDGTLQESEHPADTTECPIQAEYPIQQESHPNESATQTEKSAAREGKSKCTIFCIFCGILLLLLAIILPSVMLSRGGNESVASSQVAQGNNSYKETVLVPNLTQYTLEALDNPESCQSLAYNWVEDHPDWDTYEPWRQQQRFAMACVYYAFLGPSGGLFTLRGNWLHTDVDECLWQRKSSDGECDSTGKLTTLYVRKSLAPLKGNVPPEILYLSHLQTIDLSHTIPKSDLETFLPLNVTNAMPALQELYLSDCDLNGSIPSALSHLTTLTRIDLSKNSLSSTLPTELGRLSKMKSLLLSENDLMGSIPREIGELPSLTEFSIDNNTKVEESVPEGFCREYPAANELLHTNWCWSVAECCSFRG